MTARARREDPETSHEAAASVRVNPTQQLQFDILLALDWGPHRIAAVMSDEQIGNWIERKRGIRNFTDTGVRTRRHELVGLGFVAHSGGGRGYAFTRAGRSCRTWEITEAGMAALRKLEEKGLS